MALGIIIHEIYKKSTIFIIFINYYSQSCLFYMLPILPNTAFVRFDISNHQCICKHFLLMYF